MYLRILRTGYTYVATYIELCTIQLQKYCLIPLTRAHAVCLLCAGIERGIPVSYRYSCIVRTYIWVCIVYAHKACSVLKMLATNQYDIANWFMHARVTVTVYI